MPNNQETMEERFKEKFPHLFDGCDGREGYDMEVTDDVLVFLRKEKELSYREGRASMAEDVRKEIIFQAEPYENSKWHNELSVKQISSIINQLEKK